MSVRLGHLYPRQMNIYADRGNIAVLARRLEWRGLELDVEGIEIGETIEPARFDMFYLGGGQDRDQEVVAEDLVRHKTTALHRAAADGAPILCVCGGYQLAGAGYTGQDGRRMPGIELLDVDTVAGPTRLIGDIVIEAELDGARREVVGFENHAGRTSLGPRARPLGQVVAGHGNNGEDRSEGAVSGRVIGTYLHGPLLPKNPWLADIVLGWALEHSGTSQPLAPLDDSLEDEARTRATRRPAKR